MDKSLTWLMLAFYLLNSFCPSLAQNLNGQRSSAPSAPSSANSTSNNSNISYPSSLGARGNYSQGNTYSITAPVSTVGNTPSSLQSGGRGSGYSARGTTVNGNINNTSVGARSNGQPIGSGSQTSRSQNSSYSSLNRRSQ